MLNDRQLRWRCRRGVRELDVLLGDFLDQTYPSLEDDQKLVFQRFLEEQDPIIMDWLFGRSHPEKSEYLPLVKQLITLSGLS